MPEGRGAELVDFDILGGALGRTAVRPAYRVGGLRMSIYVILFNARTENEGIHSLQISDQERVLMFESEDDALRFGVLLEAQDFPPTAVEAFDEDEIKEFCGGAGYDAVFVPAGTTDKTLLIPPEKVVEETTWSAEEKAARTASQRGDSSDDEMDRIRRQLENLL